METIDIKAVAENYNTLQKRIGKRQAMHPKVYFHILFYILERSLFHQQHPYVNGKLNYRYWGCGRFVGPTKQPIPNSFCSLMGSFLRVIA